MVTEVISPVLYCVRGPKRDSVTHHDRMKICSGRDVPLWLRRLESDMIF